MMKVMRLLVAVLLSVTIITSYAAAENDAAIKVKWSYKGVSGPAHWGGLDPAFALCATGKRQSPIDITNKKALKSSMMFKINYQPLLLNEIDDGVTSVQVGQQYLIIADGHSVQLDVPADRQSKEILVLNNKLYKLLQFHFHTPSENRLGGVSSPAEIHFVHQGSNGELAVLAVFVKLGASNPVLQTIVDNIPKEEGKSHPLNNEIDVASLVPAKKGAYYFAGSLTTPPCTEGVGWLVMADTITASSEQIAALRRAANGANARPVQPFNKRLMVKVEEVAK